MTEYPYYIAVTYDAGLLKKIKFGVQSGRKFKTFSDCAEAIRNRYEKLPSTKNQQILILEYTNQYESKIIEICHGEWWTSIEEPVVLM